MSDKFDVIVVGGGLVGAALALALDKQGKRVALVEGQAERFDALEQGWDARIYAVSPANRAFLQQLGAWPDASRLGVIASMDVRGDQGGQIAFSAADAGAEALAWIAENRWLLAAIWQRLQQASGVTLLSGVRPQQLRHSAREAAIVLDDGRELQAQLVVGADGANSWVRQQSGIAASIKPYGHSGVVANFACAKPHGNIARQWFLGDGILAWLPMPGNRISMVWSTSQPEPLLALDGARLAAVVAAAGGHALGELTLLSPAAAFPLRLITPDNVIAERVALVGDAAHTVHPLAGQGVNLGFQDAARLAAVLAGTRDCGEWLTLRRYERTRKEAVRTMQLTCDALFQLFHAKQTPGLAWLRNAGLNLTNRLPLIKKQLARHAVGF
ncbi:UbiH/UbiF family hydroxylase [Vogesella fluminis]|uniref:Ubiquinone biosynthesis hydroxylase UbiH n=2 Tax=Vogesella fluminis TaxID=1069161 RepID=A0ABQ3H8Q2_9NEIS|nr:UbiH/UbiF family hydroxylase [Vogesella fluminis]GHD73264.1 ubiquinone biosynthesis hydroxylase UbiH [Vogesella fluminis]